MSSQTSFSPPSSVSSQKQPLKNAVCEMCFGFTKMTSYPGRGRLQESTTLCAHVRVYVCA